MNKPRERSPYAGCEVKTRDGQVFLVDDWWENVFGRSWRVADGNPAAMVYGIRIGMKGSVPLDDEVLYGKINGMGCLVHVSELCLEEG